jgi:hypothetical protein
MQTQPVPFWAEGAQDARLDPGDSHPLNIAHPKQHSPATFVV